MQTQYHSEGFSLAFVKGHIEVRTTETIVGTSLVNQPALFATSILQCPLQTQEKKKLPISK